MTETFTELLNIDSHPLWEIKDVIKKVIAKPSKKISLTVNIVYKKDAVFEDKNGEKHELSGEDERIEFRHFKIFDYECILVVTVPKFVTASESPHNFIFPWLPDYTNVTRILQHRVYDRFHTEISSRINRAAESISPNSILTDKYEMAFINDLTGIVPEIVMGYITKNVDPKIDLEVPDGLLDIKNQNGILLCHALSPFSESVGFYCELGRAFRIAKGLDLKMEVMLAGEDWGKLNWVVKDLGLEENLNYNERWRKKVYTELNIKVNSCGITSAITGLAGEYVDVAKKNWTNVDINNKRFDKSEILEYEKKKGRLFFEIEKYSIFNTTLKPITTTILCVLRKFLRLDRATFEYFLAQYYHQAPYNGWLKISIEREKDFDSSFKLISEAKGRYKSDNVAEWEHTNLTGLYFEDYSYGTFKDKNGKLQSLTAHPYYFPSANIFHHFGKDLKAAEDNCIMVQDVQNPEKIIRILSSMTRFQKSRLLADLLSFAHMLSEGGGNIRLSVSDWMKEVCPANHLYNSWFTYTDGQRNFASMCRNWSDLVFTTWNNHENLKMPYHFLPYLWSDFVSVQKEAELVMLILSEAENRFDVPELFNDGTQYAPNE